MADELMGDTAAGGDKECAGSTGGSHASTPVSEEIAAALMAGDAGATATSSAAQLDINSTEFRAALIEQIRQRPEIWNPRSAGVGQQREHREAARLAWESACVQLTADAAAGDGHTVTVEEAKRCWKQLRDSFTRCVRDEVKHGKRRKRNTWPFYASLEFLRSVVGGAWTANGGDAPTMVNSAGDTDSTTTETSASPVLPATRSPDTPTAAKRHRPANDADGHKAVSTSAAFGNESGANGGAAPSAAVGANDMGTLLALVAACQQGQSQNQLPTAAVASQPPAASANLESMLQSAVLSAALGQQQQQQQQQGDASAWLQLAALLGAAPAPAPADNVQRAPAVNDDDAAFGRTVSGCLSRLSASARDLAKVRINRVLTEAAATEQAMDASALLLAAGGGGAAAVGNESQQQQQLLAAAAAALVGGNAGGNNAGQQQQQAAALQLRQLHSLAQLQQAAGGKLDGLPGF